MPRAAFVTNDLMASSRVAPAAQSQGFELVVRGSVAAVLEDENAEGWQVVLVDLEQGDPAELMAGWEEVASRPRVIGFAPHVMEARLQAARDAGFDLVLTRGQFYAQLTELFR